MRILILSHAQYITVALPKIIEQAECLRKRGHGVTLVTTSKTSYWKLATSEQNGVRYVVSPSLLWGKLRHGADPWDVIRRTFYLLRHHQYDIIHAIDKRRTVIIPVLALKYVCGIPLVVEWSDLYSGGRTITERLSFLCILMEDIITKAGEAWK